MRRRITVPAAAVLSLVVGAIPSVAQEGDGVPMHAVANASLEWADIDVPGFLPGMKLAVLHGDPSVADAGYTIRLFLPDGYRFPPHFHPRAENVTVLEGAFFLAMGSAPGEGEMREYAPGDYLYIAARNPHYGGAKGNTLLQLHGVGPFEIIVVEGQEMSR